MKDQSSHPLKNSTGTLPPGESPEGQRAIHVVQIGYDRSLFQQDGKTDSRKRQLHYGEILLTENPGSVITIIVLGADPESRADAFGCVSLVPFSLSRAGWRKPYAWWRLYRLLTKLHADLSIDVITTQIVHDEAWVALIFRKLNGVPVVGQIHSDIFSEERMKFIKGGALGGMRYRLFLALLPFFDVVRVVAKRIAKGMAERGIRVPVEVLPVAVSPMHSNSRMEGSVRGAKPPAVTFVGRLVEFKNLGAWLEVAKLVAERDTDCIFRICGDGPCRDELEKAARKMGLSKRVSFMGWVSYGQLSGVYADSTVFLLTSHYEGLPRVVGEALSQGVPVVATRISGVEDIVEDGGCGYLHEIGDINGMADSVCRLLRDPDLVTKMGAAGRAQVRNNYNAEDLSRKWVFLLRDQAVGRRS